MERDFGQICFNRSSEKRSSPSVSNNGADSSDEFASEPRAHKQPRVLGDQIDKLPVNSGHEMACMDGFANSPLTESFAPESFNSNISSIHMNDDDESFLKPDPGTRISQDEGSSLCCFGMVCEPRIGAVAKSKDFQVIEENPIVKIDQLGQFMESRVEVCLRIAGHGVTVHHQDTMAYRGLLHQDLARPLIEICEQYGVSLFAFISKAADENNALRPNQSGRLCINLYGAKEISKNVGDVLDQAGTFLQHPQISDLAVPYFNPHYLVRPDGKHPALISEPQPAAAHETSLKLSTDHRLKSNVLRALDFSAQGPSEYSQIIPSVSIRTTLKP